MSQNQNHTRQTPRDVAKSLAMGFMHHDKRNRELSVESFAAVDTFQFQHLSEATAVEASEAYVDALWAKDAIEKACTTDGELDLSKLEDADWSPVEDAFARRASLAGMDSRYAESSTAFWRRHKVGYDYWTPMKQAQVYELRAALQDPEYPHKPRQGQSGHGPEAARYGLGVELHDTRRFDAIIDVMTPYYERIARRHDAHNEEQWTVPRPTVG